MWCCWFCCFISPEKIAAFGSSYNRLRTPVGAAEGCDLLILRSKKAQHVSRKCIEPAPTGQKNQQSRHHIKLAQPLHYPNHHT
jgi:hypothetical protein